MINHYYVLQTTSEYYTIFRFDVERVATEFIRRTKHRFDSVEMIEASHHLVIYAIQHYDNRFPVEILREYYDRRWN